MYFSLWIRKKELRCEGLEKLLSICETDDERRFLLQYLTEVFLANAGGEFPMAIPQVWIGRDMRADFIIFIPKEEECESMVVEIGLVDVKREEKIRSLGFEFYQVDRFKIRDDVINIVADIYNRLKRLENEKYKINLNFMYP